MMMIMMMMMMMMTMMMMTMMQQKENTKLGEQLSPHFLARSGLVEVK